MTSSGCTISGDISNLTKLQLFRDLTSSTAFSGSLAGLTALGYVEEGSSQSTITGWENAANFPAMCMLSQAGQTKLTQSQVDTILTSMVANMNATKYSNSWRIIRLANSGNAAPSSTGLTAKTTLTSAGWTVITN